MKTYFSGLFFALALIACSSGESAKKNNNNISEKPIDPVVSIPTQPVKSIIENEDMTPGLMGVDSNKNGIRDDIDRLIAKKYSSTPELKRAAEQVAKSMQIFMEATNRQQASAAGDENARALECLWGKVTASGSKNSEIAIAASKEIEALTANTKERFTKYLNSNKLAAGGYFPQPTGPVCD